MTVDSELRKIWRKDIARLEEKVQQLSIALARVELACSAHHPSVQLPKPEPELTEVAFTTPP